MPSLNGSKYEDHISQVLWTSICKRGKRFTESQFFLEPPRATVDGRGEFFISDVLVASLCTRGNWKRYEYAVGVTNGYLVDQSRQ